MCPGEVARRPLRCGRPAAPPGVLGGELGHAGGTRLATQVERRLAALSPLRTQVRASQLGGSGVLQGALLTARNAAQEALFPPAV